VEREGMKEVTNYIETLCFTKLFKRFMLTEGDDSALKNVNCLEICLEENTSEVCFKLSKITNFF
jgi:hypothetical protein